MHAANARTRAGRSRRRRRTRSTRRRRRGAKRQGERMRTGQLLASRAAREVARDLAALSKDRPPEPLASQSGPQSKPTRGDFRSRPTRLAWRANYSARVLAYAHDYPISPRPSLGIPGTPASCLGRRESHFRCMLISLPLLNHCAACGPAFRKPRFYREYKFLKNDTSTPRS